MRRIAGVWRVVRQRRSVRLTHNLNAEAQGMAHRLQAHCAMNAALPAPGALCASAALYCACALAHAPALNAALPASFAAVSARSFFTPRAAAPQSGSRRSACKIMSSWHKH